jgi:hypothetical protein
LGQAAAPFQLLRLCRLRIHCRPVRLDPNPERRLDRRLGLRNHVVRLGAHHLRQARLCRRVQQGLSPSCPASAPTGSRSPA